MQSPVHGLPVELGQIDFGAGIESKFSHQTIVISQSGNVEVKQLLLVLELLLNVPRHQFVGMILLLI